MLAARSLPCLSGVRCVCSDDYWSYLTGPARHDYHVYAGVPPGAPGGVDMEAFVAQYLSAH